MTRPRIPHSEREKRRDSPGSRIPRHLAGFFQAKTKEGTMELRLDGQVAVITGSSMGIGKAIARTYGLAGAHVVVNSRDSTRAQMAAAELTAAGIDTFPLAADLARPAARARRL